jgi:hypothetical protein
MATSLLCPARHKDFQSHHFGKWLLTVASTFFLLEPIGGAKPKFSQETEIFQFTKSSRTSLALLCPAQGHPLPSFRLVRPGIFISPQFFKAPIGGTKPKFSQESESLTFTKSSGTKLALLCPAQASPVPSHRLVIVKSHAHV